MRLQSTLLDMQKCKKMKLPAKPCFLSVPYESPLSLWPLQKGLCNPMMVDALEFFSGLKSHAIGSFHSCHCYDFFDISTSTRMFPSLCNSQSVDPVQKKGCVASGEEQ